MAPSFRTLAAAGAMALVLSACTVNQSEPPVVEAPKVKTQCEIDAEVLIAELETLPKIQIHEVLRGRQLRLLLESLGNPAQGDQMVVMNIPEATTYYGILTLAGCLTAHGEIRKQDYDKLKRGASI